MRRIIRWIMNVSKYARTEWRYCGMSPSEQIIALRDDLDSFKSQLNSGQRSTPPAKSAP